MKPSIRYIDGPVNPSFNLTNFFMIMFWSIYTLRIPIWKVLFYFSLFNSKGENYIIRNLNMKMLIIIEKNVSSGIANIYMKTQMLQAYLHCMILNNSW